MIYVIIIKHAKFSYNSLSLNHFAAHQPAATNSMHLEYTYTPHLSICGGTFSRKQSTSLGRWLFRRRAPSWMFDTILNETLSNDLLQLAEGLRRSFPSLGIHKAVLDSPCLLILLIYTKHKTKRRNLGLIRCPHFTSLKLYTCSQIPHPSPRVESSPN